MSEHHHDSNSGGNKPVAFTVPFILACVTLVFVFAFLSLCNPKHGHCECKEECSKECMEACEKGGPGHHEMKDSEEHGGHGAKNEMKEEKAAEMPAAPADSAKAAPAEEKH